jgi:hypothetical protein
MLTQDRLRRNKGAILFQSLWPEDVAFDYDSKAAPLLVVEQNAFLATLLLEHLNLGLQE